MWSSLKVLRPLSRPALLRCTLATTATNEGPLTLNCAQALIKAHEGESFSNISKQDVTALQGIGPKHQEQLHRLRLKTVADMANYKFYHLAKAITVLAETENEEGRLPESVMNINKGIDKAHEKQSFKQLVDAPVAALQGISEASGETFKLLGVATIGDLGRLKYCRWAEAMQVAAKYEESMASSEK